MTLTDSEDEPRFGFGQNWRSYLERVDPRRMEIAQVHLQSMLGDDLSGVSLLDIGSGSGLFSLAAARAGARVHSFDFDRDSVSCAEALRDRYMPESESWTIEQGSVLDTDFVGSLGHFDIVYSWGVLHHTGAMWKAIENAASAVSSGGRLAIALYNDQGFVSRVWTLVKRLYVRGPRWLRALLLGLSWLVIWGPQVLRDAVRRRDPLRAWRAYSERGMSAWSDLVDWVGGYPFEVVRPEPVIEFLAGHGFRLVELVRRDGRGNHEFLFERA